jgi:hypothetical protein
MEGQTADADGTAEKPSNHVAAAAPAAAPAAAAALADPQQDAEALLHSQHTGEEDEIAEVDPQNRYYRYTVCLDQAAAAPSWLSHLVNPCNHPLTARTPRVAVVSICMHACMHNHQFKLPVLLNLENCNLLDRKPCTSAISAICGRGRDLAADLGMVTH